MRAYIRDRLLAYRYTNMPYRRVAKKWRQLKKKLSSTDKTYGKITLFVLFLFRSDSRFIKYLVTSKAFKQLFESNTVLSNFLTDVLWQVTSRIKNRSLHVYVAALLDRRKEFSKSFVLYFELIQKAEKPSMGWVTRAINAEKHITEKKFYEYFFSHPHKFEENSKHAIICDYSLERDSIIPEWDSIKKCIKQTGTEDLLLINKSLLAALPFKNIAHFSFVEEILVSAAQKSEQDKKILRRSITLLAVCYYRLGLTNQLVNLNEKISYSNHDWNIYVQFALGNHMEAMEHRAQSILTSFQLAYPGKVQQSDHQKTLIPEKDLCGEVFNAMFYDELAKDIENIQITCDVRLHTRLVDRFPQINFLPKQPRVRRLTSPESFVGIPVNLGDFLDTETYSQTKNTAFVPLNYSKYYEKESCQYKKTNGWLRSNKEQCHSMRRKLNIADDAFVISFSANSTVRSRVRDMHMIDVSVWENVFTIPNCVFVNINPSFDKSECDALEKRFGCQIISPNFDLYNDFESLLDILSASNAAIVPANNLMDFASATATPSFVFSPSNIMKVWVNGSGNKYLFSNHVEFIFQEERNETLEMMVLQCREKLLNLMVEHR